MKSEETDVDRLNEHGVPICRQARRPSIQQLPRTPGALQQWQRKKQTLQHRYHAVGSQSRGLEERPPATELLGGAALERQVRRSARGNGLDGPMRSQLRQGQRRKHVAYDRASGPGRE